MTCNTKPVDQVVVKKYRSWLHSDEPKLQAEARKWAISRQDIVRKYDNEGYIVDFESLRNSC